MNARRAALIVAVVAIGVGAFGALGVYLRSVDDETQVVTASETAVAGPADVAGSYDEIPETATDEDGYALPGLEFGYITKAWKKDGKVRISLLEAEFYIGKAAKTINDGITPPNDYLIVGDDTMGEFDYVVAEEASLVGINTLLDEPGTIERKSITAEQLVKNFNRDGAGRVAVWLRHEDPSLNDGPVTALAEQYIP